MTKRRREPVELPKVGPDAPLREIMLEMDARKAGFIARARSEWRARGMVTRPSNAGPGYTEVLHRSARPDTPYQVTHLNAEGEPWGHAEPKTLEEAFAVLRDYSRRPVPKGRGLQHREGRIARDPVPRSLPKIYRGRLLRT